MSGSSRGLTECYANESWKDESLAVQRCKKRLRADSRRTDSKNWPVTRLQQFLQVWPKAGASIFSSSRGQSAKIENSQPQKMWMVTSPRLGCIAVITATCLIHRGPGNQSIKWSSYQRTHETEPSELAAAGGIPKTQPTCTQSSRPVASLRARPFNYLHIVHHHVFAQQNTFILKYDTCPPNKTTGIHEKVK